MNRVARIFAVTAGLCVAGALMGAVAGSIVLSLGVAISERSARTLLGGDTWRAGAVFGSVAGLIAGPAGAWLLMRRAPLGAAIGLTTIGTVLGGVAGWILGEPASPQYGLLGGFIGFVASAVFVRRRFTTSAPVSPGPSRRETPSDADA